MVAPVMLLKGWPREKIDQYDSTHSSTDSKMGTIPNSLEDFVFDVGRDVFQDKDNTAVGYVSGFESSYYDVVEETLYLSRVLSAPVTGVHNERYMPCGLVRHRIQAILYVWERFFDRHPKGRFIQYGFEEGMRIVQRALACSPYENQIVLVGINFHICLDRPCDYYFRNFTHLPTLCAPSMITIPYQDAAEANFLLPVTDPTWISALQYSYYCTVGLEHFSSAIGFKDYNNKLDPERGLCTPLQLRMLADMSYTRSSAISFERLFCVAVSVLRVIDYHIGRCIVRGTDGEQCFYENSTMSTDLADLTSTVFESYWVLYAVSEVVLLWTRNHPIRRAALIVTSAGFFWNIADITSQVNVLMSMKPECIYRPIGAMLTAYGVGAFLRDISFGLIRTRQYTFKIVDRCLRALGINADENNPVDRVFHRNVRNIRAFLSLLFMVCLGSCFLTRRLFTSANTLSWDWVYYILHSLFLLLFVPGSAIVLLSADSDEAPFSNPY